MRNCVPSKEAAKAIAKMESATPGADKQCLKCGLFKVNCICSRKPRQRLWKVALQSADENWTKHTTAMGMTSSEAWKQANLRKGYKGKTRFGGDQPDLTSVAPLRRNGKQVMIEPIGWALQSIARGFFRKLFGKRRDQDHCRGEGKPLCHICNDMRHLWVRVDDDMVALRCVGCDPISAKEQARVQRKLLRVADTLADLRQPVPA